MLDVRVIAYMGNIVISTERVEEHLPLVQWMIESPRKKGLCVRIKKSSFHQWEVEFLGCKISDRGGSITSRKIKEIRAWSMPIKIVEMESFMGFANFYYRFINSFSKIAKPLMDLTKKSIKWLCTLSCQDAFETLKEMFTMGPILTHFDDTSPTKLKIDASDFVLGAILSELYGDKKWRPLAFYSRKFSPAEINYDVYDKQIATIVAFFKEWAFMLILVHDWILVYTDHKNLEYFNTTKTQNRRQHRWAEFLQPFNSKLIYREELLNEKVDVLLRYSGVTIVYVNNQIYILIFHRLPL